MTTTLTLSSVAARLLAIPSPGERLQLDLLRDLVRQGWRDLYVCTLCGLDAVTCEHTAPGDSMHDHTGSLGKDLAQVPAWGLGVAMLTIGVANWGVDWTPNPTIPHLSASGPTDPAKLGWEGPRHKSGKHMLDGSTAYPYGGLGLCHLDSGGLLDAYERWDWPGARANFSESTKRRDGTLDRAPIAFDALRNAGGSGWRMWLAWADALLARPEFHEWLIGYWLREFWAPSWRTINPQPDEYGSEIIPRVCINARIRNSAKSWAKDWSHLSCRGAGQAVCRGQAEGPRRRRSEAHGTSGEVRHEGSCGD